MAKQVIYIVGPTACGKTDLAIRLAKKLETQIIGADSMQIYKYIEVGTAKPTKHELDGVTHHMIDFVEPNDYYTVAQYKDDALKIIDDIHKKHKIPIVCGGTGLYINSLLYKMDFTKADFDLEYRSSLKKFTNQQVYDMLVEVDPKTAMDIPINNRKRIERALEIFHISKVQKSAQVGDYKNNPRDYEHHVFILDMDRQLLYDRINKRVDIMLEKGLVKEVQMLKQMSIPLDKPIFQFIGYKEIIDYLDGNTTIDEAINAIKQNTRHFAKRQLTWFRNLYGIPSINWLKISNNKDEMVDTILKCLN